MNAGLKQQILYRRSLRGDPGLSLKGILGGVKKIGGIVGKVPIIGKIAPKLIGAIPGVGTVATLASLGLSAAKGLGGASKVASASRAVVPFNQAFATSQLARATGGRMIGPVAAGAAAAAGGYAVGRRMKADGTPAKRPTMNPLNRRAAARATRRIKSVVKLLHTIESSLPKRKCSCSRTTRRK